KSSFVRAGIVPALKHSGETWSAEVVRPGRAPMESLARLIASVLDHVTGHSGSHSGSLSSSDSWLTPAPPSSSVSASRAGPASAVLSDPGTGSGLATGAGLADHRAIIARLYDEPGYLGVVLRSRARKRGANVLLCVDQFEELYTLGGDERERRAFTACLAGVADDATAPLRVVLSIRSDFLDRVPEDPHFMAELSHGLIFLTPPGRAGLRDALVQPAEMAGYQFESRDTVEHMLDHLEHIPGSLPLLQFAASKLWDARDSERRLLTVASYDRLGGIAGALATHADAVLAEFPAQDQRLVRAIVLRLITPERTRAIVSLAELDELATAAGAGRPGGERANGAGGPSVPSSIDGPGDQASPTDEDASGAVRRIVDHLARARLL
ncbi:MAG: hypothetical protein AAGC55_32575, partial [Myxococcota bacterium]